MATYQLPSTLLFRCYLLSIVITMTSLLYAGVIALIVALGSKIDLTDPSDAIDFFLLVFFIFPGVSSLFIWPDYRRRVAFNSACRSVRIEIVGIASCLPTLLISFFIVTFFGIS